MTTRDNINKALKLYNSCSSKFTNMLPWTEPIPDRISTAIDILKQCILEYKITKNLDNQIKYSFLMDTFYDEYYKYTHDRLCKSSQAVNLKELIQLCEKDNKNTFINNTDIKHNIFDLINKFTKTSEETGEENNMISCYKFILEFYKNPLTETQINFVCEIYEKIRNIKGEYDERFGDLLVTQKQNYTRGAEIYEEIANNRTDKSTKFSIDVLLMKAFICYLCVDEVLAERKLNEYEINFSIITNTMNFKLCRNIMTEYKNRDVDKYIDYIRDYNDIKRLDDYIVGLLNKIKKQITTEEIDLC